MNYQVRVLDQMFLFHSLVLYLNKGTAVFNLGKATAVHYHFLTIFLNSTQFNSTGFECPGSFDRRLY